MTLLEVCIDERTPLDGELFTHAGRLEVCARLDLGGLTPTSDLLARCVALERVPCFAMVRPRAGDFVYAGDERTQLVADLERVVSLGAHGVVLGALTADGELDHALLRAALASARGRPATFHRAFDHVRERERALDELVDLGFTRVLTSGGASDAYAGRDELARLVRHARGRITILPGGGVRAHNAEAILAATGVTELHGSQPFALR